MKKLFISLLVLFSVVHLYGAEHAMLQTKALEDIIRQYGMVDSSSQEIDVFLGKYPDGSTFQHVFSNRQAGDLCGVYAMQNSLWYRYMMGNINLLKPLNKSFTDLLNSIVDVKDSGLNGIETEVFQKLLASKCEPGFAIIAFQENRHVPLNAAGMELFFGDALGYLSDLISNKIPVVSLLINCAAQDTYGRVGIQGHWVSVTMIQNKTKRLYLMADSLPDEDGAHRGFVLEFLNQVEERLGVKKIEFIKDIFAAEFQVPANNRRDERLRKEFLHQLSPDDIFVKVKRICTDKLVENGIDNDTQRFIFDNVINPALQDLDEATTVQVIAENLRGSLQSGFIDNFENAQVLYAIFYEIIALLEEDQKRLDKITLQEGLGAYWQKLHDLFNQKFVNADDVIIVHANGNREVKELIVGLIMPLIENAIDVASVASYTGACSSVEQCVNTQDLIRSISTKIAQNFDLITDMGVFITQQRLCEMLSVIVGQVQTAIEDKGEPRTDPVESSLVFQPMLFQTGLTRLLPRVSGFPFFQFQIVPPAVGAAAGQNQTVSAEEVD